MGARKGSSPEASPPPQTSLGEGPRRSSVPCIMVHGRLNQHLSWLLQMCLRPAWAELQSGVLHPEWGLFSYSTCLWAPQLHNGLAS